jgi:putative phosphoribosyl transferase
MVCMRFRDRAQAGRRLAEVIRTLPLDDSAIVLGLPRGGVPVAAEVARLLKLPLDVLCVRKIGVPFQPELAMGAVASGGAVVRNEDVIDQYATSPAEFDTVLEAERAELERRERRYRGDASPLQIARRAVILVDDGLATGATMEAGVRALRAANAERVVVAVPVGAPEACERLSAVADEVVCLQRPMFFSSVGRWYQDFGQTSDEEVAELLHRARCEPPG